MIGCRFIMPSGVRCQKHMLAGSRSWCWSHAPLVVRRRTMRQRLQAGGVVVDASMQRY